MTIWVWAWVWSEKPNKADSAGLSCAWTCTCTWERCFVDGAWDRRDGPRENRLEGREIAKGEKGLAAWCSKIDWAETWRGVSYDAHAAFAQTEVDHQAASGLRRSSE